LVKGKDLLVVKNKGKLKYKLIAVKMEEWVLINTQLHSKIVENALINDLLPIKAKKIRKEVSYKDSRLDFLVNDNIYIEVKGSNLLKNNKCLFPNAPSLRAYKHIKDLIELVKKGKEAIILFLILRDCKCFEENKEIDKNFSIIFRKALKEGVKFLAFKIKIDEKRKTILFDKLINLC